MCIAATPGLMIIHVRDSTHERNTYFKRALGQQIADPCQNRAVAVYTCDCFCSQLHQQLIGATVYPEQDPYPSTSETRGWIHEVPWRLHSAERELVNEETLHGPFVWIIGGLEEETRHDT